MTCIKELSIQHYKWFFEEQTLELWLPNWKDNWSWLTVITWPNNTGKTSIVESLLIWEKNKKFFDSDCHPWFSPKIKFTWADGSQTEYTNVNWWSLVQTIWNKNSQIAPVFSRRYWNNESSIERDDRVYFNALLWKNNIRDNWVQELIPMLKNIQSVDARTSQFNRIINQILPSINRWTICSDAHWDYVKYISNWWQEHRSNSLWDGVLSIFVICASLSSALFDRHTIIIDEPELSLHPQAQKRLASVLSNESKDRQIIICTHSPYFVNWEDFINWAKFVRLNKHNDEKCTIWQLKNNENYERFIEKNLYEYQKPQLLDVVSKEIMFSDKILFVEWQEDVWLIRKRCSSNDIHLNFDIFWYGAWCYSNITKFFLSLAKDLWIMKVWVLYDNWIDTTEAFENNIKEYKHYYFEKLSTSDIRDKKWNNGEIIKEWIFDEHWNIKPEKKEEFKNIIKNFIEYFN